MKPFDRLSQSIARVQTSLKKDVGAALMMAIFCVTMLMVIATEIMYETNVELAVSSQSVNQVKAHYAAVAGVEISLLRIFIYRKAVSMIGDSPLRSMLDPIWQIPFAWPPMIPGSATRVDREEIQDKVKQSTMQGSYLSTIEPEGARIDINDLASPLKGIADQTKARIKDIFLAKLKSDENFNKKYQSYDFDLLVENIKDYVDEDKISEKGGQESSLYQNMGKADFYPPNQPFKTVEEIHMVSGMIDELFDVLKPNITIYGSGGINVNYAGKEIFRALDPVQFTDERIGKIIARRDDQNQGGLYKDDKDFLGYIQQLGIDDRWYKDAQGKPKVLLLFEAEYNFRIRSTGKSGKTVQRDITAIVYDFDRAKLRLAELAKQMASPTPSQTQPPGQNPQTGQPPAPSATPQNTQAKANAKVPNERPNIVYWNEQ